MFYRGPGFLAVIYDLAPPPPPLPFSKLDRRHTERLRKRDNLLTWEGEEKPNQTKAVILFGSSPNPSHPFLPSVSSTGDTQEDWESDATCWPERGKEEPNQAKAWSSINHSILSGLHESGSISRVCPVLNSTRLFVTGGRGEKICANSAEMPAVKLNGGRKKLII